MAADTLNIFHAFVEDVAEGVHDLANDQLLVTLSNVQPTTASDGQLSDITVIANIANVDTLSITTSSSSQTSGTYSLILTDLTITATGAVGPFQYVVLYNGDATNDELIGWLDYGSEVTMSASETFDLDWPGTATVSIAVA